MIINALAYYFFAGICYWSTTKSTPPRESWHAAHPCKDKWAQCPEAV